MKYASLITRVSVVVVVGLGLKISANAASRLLPFQGRLTDADGRVVADGERVVQFKLYDAPVAGQSVWSGEVQKLSVNNGLISTVLGSKSSLDGVDFSKEIYLELTVDANGDGLITLADPPLLPRQSTLPSVFAWEASNSRKLSDHDWSDILVSGNNPATGFLRGDKIAPNSIDSSRLSPVSVGSAQLIGGSVTSAKLADGSVTFTKLSDDFISKLAAVMADRLVPPGIVGAYAGTDSTAVPTGWLFCDGRPVSRTNYAALFATIGTQYGAGDGTTTFNLPDYRWTFLRGYGTNITVQGSGTANLNKATFVDHGFNRSGVKVRLTSGSLSGLSLNTDYWVIVVDQNTLSFAKSKADAVALVPMPVNISGVNQANIGQWEDPDVASRQANAKGGQSTGIGSFEDQQLLSHNHSYAGVTYWDGNANKGDNGSGVQRFRGWGNYGTAPYGGNETRPQNISVQYIIKY